MSTIGSALRGDTVSASKPKGPIAPQGQPRPQSRYGFYLLHAGEALALVLFLSFCIMWAQWQMAAPRITKVSGDFVSFWTAGELVLEGHAADAYREVPHFFKELDLHGEVEGWGYLAFFYPPFFLLLCAGLALLNYLPALILWLTATCAGYAAALRAMLPQDLRQQGVRLWVLFLGYPAVLVNAGFGQNGFLSAGLLGGAAVWLDRRPELAGLCLGCLAYKPQLGLIVPLALAVAGRWRCFAAAGLTVVGLVAVATVAFGMDIWPAFFADMAEARRNWMEFPNPLYLQFWITVFGMIRLHGGSLALAYGAQAVVSITAALMLTSALLRRPPGSRSGVAEGAAIAACVPFCSPFMLEYDLVILAVPMAWLLGEALRDGFRPYERLALIGTFLAPIAFKVTAFDSVMKGGVIAAAALLFVVVLRRMTAPASALSYGLPASDVLAVRGANAEP
jgi:alpha-1,2-mannosyltransferase